MKIKNYKYKLDKLINSNKIWDKSSIKMKKAMLNFIICLENELVRLIDDIDKLKKVKK